MHTQTLGHLEFCACGWSDFEGPLQDCVTLLRYSECLCPCMACKIPLKMTTTDVSLGVVGWIGAFFRDRHSTLRVDASSISHPLLMGVPQGSPPLPNPLPGFH